MIPFACRLSRFNSILQCNSGELQSILDLDFLLLFDAKEGQFERVLSIFLILNQHVGLTLLVCICSENELLEALSFLGFFKLFLVDETFAAECRLKGIFSQQSFLKTHTFSGVDLDISV